MTPRAALLATTCAVGLLSARALDGFGLLPGVTESAQLRRTVLDPRLTALGLVGCLLVGLVAAALHRVHASLAGAALVGGQVGLVVGLEELGRALTGAPEPPGGETGLWVAVALQVVLAVLAVTTVVLLALRLPELRAAEGEQPRSARFPSYRGVDLQVVRNGSWERGPPPRACLLRTHPTT